VLWESATGRSDGDDISWVFKAEFQGNEIKTVYEGKVIGAEMKQ
jgi:hypothetical protein